MSVGGSSSQPVRSSTTSSSSPLTNNQPRARSSGEYVISANVVDFLKNKKFSVKHILVIVCLFYIVCPPESYLYVMDFSAGSTNRTSGTSTTAGPSPSPLGSANSSIFCLCLGMLSSPFINALVVFYS